MPSWASPGPGTIGKLPTKLPDGISVESKTDLSAGKLKATKAIYGKNARLMATAKEELAQVEAAEFVERYRQAFPQIQLAKDSIMLSPARLLLAIALPVLMAGCSGQDYKTVANTDEKGTNVAFQTADGSLKTGPADCQLVFTDAARKPVAVEGVTLTFEQAAGAGGKAFSVPVTLSANGTGRFAGQLDLGSQGRWNASVTWKQGGLTKVLRTYPDDGAVSAGGRSETPAARRLSATRNRGTIARPPADTRNGPAHMQPTSAPARTSRRSANHAVQRLSTRYLAPASLEAAERDALWAFCSRFVDDPHREASEAGTCCASE